MREIGESEIEENMDEKEEGCVEEEEYQEENSIMGMVRYFGIFHAVNNNHNKLRITEQSECFHLETKIQNHFGAT